MAEYINVIGAGLAGCEAAWQISKFGIKVRLFEMKPHSYTPAHNYETFGELVCSNSLGSNRIDKAPGLLKQEMRLLDSIIIKCADATCIPAGEALAVDREKFSRMLTDIIKQDKNIEVINKEVTEIPDDEITIIATGPLTSPALSRHLKSIIGENYLYFFDAASPIVTYESINMEKVFRGSRYDNSSGDYINCPMDKEQYELFWNELVNAEVADVKDFEKDLLFEGCMPIESMAKRGIDTLRFGPLRPVGFINPLDGKRPYAVVQLRQDNAENTLYNLVGFQTRLKWGEQKRVFRLIPGLENAEFVRYGVMHKNTYINSPKLLSNTYRLRNRENIFFAGQITGVEGYVESAGSGLVAGINAARLFQDRPPVVFPENTMLGSLAVYVSGALTEDFQPMNANFGLLPPVPSPVRDKKQRKLALAERALDAVKNLDVE